MIDTSGRERPGLYIETQLFLGDMTCEKYVADHDGGGYRERVRDLSEDDWIPCIVAAHLAGVSKQAISDRIKRGTLEARESHRKNWWNEPGQKVLLVRYGDAMKKKKAGRPPRRSARPKKSRDSLETEKQNTAFLPHSFQCTGFPMCANCKRGKYTDNGKTLPYYTCQKQKGVHMTPYYHCENFQFTEEAAAKWDKWSQNNDYRHLLPYIAWREESWNCPHCKKENPAGTYYCTGCCAYTADHAMAAYCVRWYPGLINKHKGKPLTTPAVDITALAEKYKELEKYHFETVPAAALLEESGLDMELSDFFPIFDQVIDYIYADTTE